MFRHVLRPTLLGHFQHPVVSRTIRRHLPSTTRRSSEWAAAKASLDAEVEEWKQRHGDAKTLLVVYHSRTGGAAEMARQVVLGALEGLERPLDVPSLQAEWEPSEFRALSANPAPKAGASSSNTGAGCQISGLVGEQPPSEDGEGEVHVRVLPAPLARPVDLVTSAGFVFVCPENLAAMSGPMKDFFDRCFYPVLNRLNGRPYQALICAGSDGTGATRQLERIATGWRLKRVEETVVVNVKAQTEERVYATKEIGEEDRKKCREAGMRLAVGLSVGMF